MVMTSRGWSMVRSLAICAAVIGVAGGCQRWAEGRADAVEEKSPPRVAAESDVEAGRYLVIMGGCNDCHTDGYMQSEGNVPEESWLAGSPVGWRGPWGTTYAKNLRLTAQDLTEEQWVVTLKQRRALPPMPWMNVNQMSEADARVLYRYIRSLGPAGERMPVPVPPGQEPTTPFISLTPLAPGG